MLKYDNKEYENYMCINYQNLNTGKFDVKLVC
jgi:hypothetical protein